MRQAVVYSIICLILALSSARAQVDPLFSQYMQDATALNPAYAGAQEVLAITVQARSQWQNTEGGPLTGIVSAHSIIPNSKFGVGLRISREALGIASRIRVSPAAAYRISWGNKVISAGLGVNYNNLNQGFQSLDLEHTEDGVFALANQASYWSVATGLYLRAPKWYVGASIPELYTISPEMAEGRSLLGRRAGQYTLHSGLVLPLGTDWLIKPNILVNLPSVGAAYADVNLNLLYREVLEAGISGRTNGTVAGLVRFQVNRQLSIGYATDFALNPQANFAGKTHELGLQFKFWFDKSSMPSPRFF